MMKLTMKEIAEQANVSPATVSRVLNGNGEVAPDKRERVMQILAAETRKKRWVNRRKRHKTRNVGLILLSGSRHDIRAVGTKIINITEQLPANYDLRIFPDPVNARLLETLFLRGELDGLLISGHQIKDMFLSILLEKIPHVWLNSHYLDDSRGVSLMGNEFAGKIAANYLLQHNCQKPAVLVFKNDNIGLNDRISGFSVHCFLQKKQAREIEVDIPLSQYGNDFVLQNGQLVEDSIVRALDAIPEKDFPDGIFSPEEIFTPYLYRAFTRKKLENLPLVISCNYTPGYLAGLYPRPASIDLHQETLVKLAIDELVNRIDGGSPRPDNIATIVQPELIPGEII